MSDPDADMSNASLTDTSSPFLSTKLSEHDSGTTKDRLHEVREEAGTKIRRRFRRSLDDRCDPPVETVRCW